MLKISKQVFIILLLLSSLSFSKELKQSEIKEIENLLLFKKVGIKVDKAYEVDSFYLLYIKVRGKINEIYLTKDKKYLLSDVIDTGTGKKLTIPADVSILKNKESLTFGTGKDRYYVFTDPECPYCKQFESHFDKIKKKVDMKIFYYPLDFHKDAKALSMYIMSKKTNSTKIEAMLHIDKNNKDFLDRKYTKDEEDKLKKDLEIQIELANTLRIKGTPAILDKDGNRLSWVELLEQYGVKIK